MRRRNLRAFFFIAVQTPGGSFIYSFIPLILTTNSHVRIKNFPPLLNYGTTLFIVPGNCLPTNCQVRNCKYSNKTKNEPESVLYSIK